MKKQKESITSLDLYYILFGYVINIGIWSLPKSQVVACHQDGWIATLIGGLYPLIIVLLSCYIIDKAQNESILTLSENLFGKIIGNILNLIFLTFFFIIGVMVISGLNNILKVYGVGFLSPIKIIGISVILGGLAAYKGLKVVAKFNKLIFYIMIGVLLITVPAFWKGTFLNLQPMFQTPIANIIKGSIDTFYSYSGIEAMLLLTKYVSDKENIRKKSLLMVLVGTVIYVYAVVVTIYYSGPKIVTKSLWPLVIVSESTKISIINNFRFIFSSMWILIALRGFMNFYFACATITEHFFKKVNKRYIYIGLYWIFLYFAMKFTNESFRRYFINLISIYYVSFNFLFILAIAIVIFFKKGVENEKK